MNKLGIRSNYNAMLPHILKQIGQMKYYRFDQSSRGNFRQIKRLPYPDQIAFKQERKKMIMEKELVRLIWPYIAYITAPDGEQRELLILDVYERYRNKFGEEFVDELGLKRVSPDERVKDYENFSNQFTEAASSIEKALKSR